MSIKSDKWIKKMSLDQKMIEPFSENQVRLDAEGNKLISYGVSSYGYDVRCSNEFKVFTNIHSSTVCCRAQSYPVFDRQNSQHLRFLD